MNRRGFNIALASAATTPLMECATDGMKDGAGRTVLYSSIGDTLTQYDVDVAAATLTQRNSLTLPSVLQYAWPHPSRHYLYASTSDAAGGSPAGAGKLHRLCALRVDADGALALHGEPQNLSMRPIHNSVDASGSYALTCYSNPANLTVHKINTDGTLGPEVKQTAQLDTGIFPHQIRSTPGNRSVVLVTRGNNATVSKAEDPGALKLYNFRDGQLLPLANVQTGGKGGLGYGPRHVDFHPTKPWAYVLLERQNKLHMHVMQDGNFAPEPSYTQNTLMHDNPPDIVHQVAGAIHMHPHGHVVYVANRASGTMEFNGQQVYRGGQNSIAVFALNPNTGEPTLLQHVEPQGFHVRTFSIDPSGQLLVAATMLNMLVRDGDTVRHVSAGLNVFRIAEDGRLTLVRSYDVEVGKTQQLWMNMMELPG